MSGNERGYREVLFCFAFIFIFDSTFKRSHYHLHVHKEKKYYYYFTKIKKKLNKGYIKLQHGFILKVNFKLDVISKLPKLISSPIPKKRTTK